MKSGLEGRNNKGVKITKRIRKDCLNEVRPRRPEQSEWISPSEHEQYLRLNEVRPRRPEQFRAQLDGYRITVRLNEVRPRRPEQ